MLDRGGVTVPHKGRHRSIVSHCPAGTFTSGLEIDSCPKSRSQFYRFVHSKESEIRKLFCSPDSSLFSRREISFSRAWNFYKLLFPSNISFHDVFETIITIEAKNFIEKSSFIPERYKNFLHLLHRPTNIYESSLQFQEIFSPLLPISREIIYILHLFPRNNFSSPLLLLLHRLRISFQLELKPQSSSSPPPTIFLKETVVQVTRARSDDELVTRIFIVNCKLSRRRTRVLEVDRPVLENLATTFFSLPRSSNDPRGLPGCQVEKRIRPRVEGIHQDSFPAISSGLRPCRLFVIVICITMDETRIMGSQDLPGSRNF